jgi:hypothetical protein
MVSEETVDSIIVGIGKSGNHTGNIIDFLNYTRYDFDEAFQIANESSLKNSFLASWNFGIELS